VKTSHEKVAPRAARAPPRAACVLPTPTQDIVRIFGEAPAPTPPDDAALAAKRARIDAAKATTEVRADGDGAPRSYYDVEFSGEQAAAVLEKTLSMYSLDDDAARGSFLCMDRRDQPCLKHNAPREPRRAAPLAARPAGTPLAAAPAANRGNRGATLATHANAESTACSRANQRLVQQAAAGHLERMAPLLPAGGADGWSEQLAERLADSVLGQLTREHDLNSKRLDETEHGRDAVGAAVKDALLRALQDGLSRVRS
jgi:hypothetical protein